MCGIAGFVEVRRRTPADGVEPIAAAMAAMLHHRGPDAGGTWSDPDAGVALAHRRLAIRDLSVAGAQPMMSTNGRYVLVYNGEIYDTDRLRQDLPGPFRGTSDTEVLLAGLAHWGIRPTVERLNGMFAFALWDRRERILTLARDRFGIKPLYWADADGVLLFASELAPLEAHPVWKPELDRGALAAYLRLAAVPAPLCIWQGARKLEPGHLLTLHPGRRPVVERYWDPMILPAQPRLALSADEAADGVEEHLRGAVRRRLVADVPLGVFLSGGIDSAAVAALACATADGPVRTYTIGFEDAEFDESADAAAIARHLGTEHHAATLTAADALAVIPDLPRVFDEPFADSSQVPTLLLARFARRHVTVALSGDGGDEVFAGYTRYRWAARHWLPLRRLPRTARALAAALIHAVPPATLDRLGRLLAMRHAGEKLHKLAAVLPSEDLNAAYRLLAGHGLDGAVAMRGVTIPAGPPLPPLDDPVEVLQFLDTVGYLPDDILTKVDRTTMSVALEARVPLLDPELVAFAWRLPRQLKLDGGPGKAVLRRVLARHLPPALFEGRPKSGFAVPVHAWLRGPLKEWAGDLLSAESLGRDGVLDPVTINLWWLEHQSGRRDRGHVLWTALMFQAWRRHRENGPREARGTDPGSGE